MLIIFSGKIRLLKSKYFSFSESEEGMRIGGSENDSKNTQQDGRKNIGVGVAKSNLFVRGVPLNSQKSVFSVTLCSLPSFVALELICHCRPLVVYGHERCPVTVLTVND